MGRKKIIRTNDLSKRQKEIIDTSVNIILKKGIQCLTLRNIADDMGFSESAVYRHFDSKSHIICTIGDNIIKIFNLTEENLKIENSSALDRLYNYEKRWVGIVKKNKNFIPMFFSFSFLEINDEKTRKIIQTQNQLKVHLLEVIQHGVDTGEFTKDLDVENALSIFIGTIRSITSKYITGKLEVSFEKALERNWKTLRKIFL